MVPVVPKVMGWYQTVCPASLRMVPVVGVVPDGVSCIPEDGARGSQGDGVPPAGVSCLIMVLEVLVACCVSYCKDDERCLLGVMHLVLDSHPCVFFHILAVASRDDVNDGN
jgi:hypothetical protein